MPQEVYIDKSAGVIIVRAWGVITTEDLHASKEAVKALSEEAGLTLVLADVHEQTTTPSVLAYYRFAQGLADDPVLRKIRFALLASASTQQESRFFETTANNRGLKVRLFQARDEALGWLVGETGSA